MFIAPFPTKEVPTTTTLGKDFNASFTATRFAFLLALVPFNEFIPSIR